MNVHLLRALSLVFLGAAAALLGWAVYEVRRPWSLYEDARPTK